MKQLIGLELKKNNIFDNRFLKNIKGFKSKTFYKYRALNKYSLNDLLNNTITMTNPRVFNDLYDSITLKSSYNYELKELEKSIKISKKAVGAAETIKIYKQIIENV